MRQSEQVEDLMRNGNSSDVEMKDASQGKSRRDEILYGASAVFFAGFFAALAVVLIALFLGLFGPEKSLPIWVLPIFVLVLAWMGLLIPLERRVLGRRNK